MAAPKVAVTIAPIHSLVASVMQGVSEPQLLLKPDTSPHHATLVPSQIKGIQDADIVFYVDSNYETFLAKPLTIKGDKAVALLQNAEIQKLDMRTMGMKETHQEPTHKDDHDHDCCHDDHDHGAVDPHIWLDIDNAQAIVDEILINLSAIDVMNAPTYATNAKALKEKLSTLKEDLMKLAKPFSGKTFVAAHDGFQYFEKMMGLKAVGFLGTSQSLDTSTKRYKDVQDLLAQKKVSFLFQEPQMASPHLKKLAQAFKVPLLEMDSMGAKIQPGLDHYSKLMINLVEKLEQSGKPTHGGTKP